MRNFSMIALCLCLASTACSGGGGTGGTTVVPGDPAPTPTPTPTPSPTPTPTPTVSLSYLHSYAEILPGGAATVGLVEASDGNFYGASQSGPNMCRPALPVPCGAIIKVTPTGQQSIFYAFGSAANDGYMPSRLVLGRDGALYGTTINGGTFGGGGTFFRITLSGQYSSLYSFGGSPSDAVSPVGIIQGSDGNFYGTSASGGANVCAQIPQAGTNCGTVFRVTPTGDETILHSFGASASDGIEPQATLVEGVDGSFYGTTSIGGTNQCGSEANSCGTVFRITPTGALSILHSFGASAGDGIAPLGALIRGNDGAYYGVTPAGGGTRCSDAFGCGTVFRVTTAGTLSIIYAFGQENRLTGDGPNSLIVGRDGNFYGTTISGGANQCDSCGTMFRLTPSGVLTTLYSFGPLNTNPARPGFLTQASDGAFYGLNDSGTFGSPLTVFRLTVN